MKPTAAAYRDALAELTSEPTPLNQARAMTAYKLDLAAWNRERDAHDRALKRYKAKKAAHEASKKRRNAAAKTCGAQAASVAAANAAAERNYDRAVQLYQDRKDTYGRLSQAWGDYHRDMGNRDYAIRYNANLDAEYASATRKAGLQPQAMARYGTAAICITQAQKDRYKSECSMQLRGLGGVYARDAHDLVPDWCMVARLAVCKPRKRVAPLPKRPPPLPPKPTKPSPPRERTVPNCNLPPLVAAPDPDSKPGRLRPRPQPPPMLAEAAPELPAASEPQAGGIGAGGVLLALAVGGAAYVAWRMRGGRTKA